MQVTITDKEFEAIEFALTQIGTAIQSSTNEDFTTTANEAMDALASIKDKYCNARYKANLLNDTIAMIRKKEPYWISGNDAAKIARQYLKEHHKK